MLGMEQLSLEDRNAVARARRLERFLTQPFFTTEQFSGMKGKLVSLKDSLDGCERILRDEFKDYPESGLYMIGAIVEAKKPETNQPTEKTPEEKQPDVTQPKATRSNGNNSETKNTDPQPRVATASTHES
jgi:F-type H+-transporting ATPase subunit beta